MRRRYFLYLWQELLPRHQRPGKAHDRCPEQHIFANNHTRRQHRLACASAEDLHRLCRGQGKRCDRPRHHGGGLTGLGRLSNQRAGGNRLIVYGRQPGDHRLRVLPVCRGAEPRFLKGRYQSLASSVVGQRLRVKTWGMRILCRFSFITLGSKRPRFRRCFAPQEELVITNPSVQDDHAMRSS